MSGLDKVVLELIEDKLETVLAPYAEILRIANRPKKDKYGYSNKEAMLYMEIGETEIKKLRDSGDLPFQYSQGKYRYKKEDMDRYLDQFYTKQS
jgi:hypothetical protein